MDASKVRLTLIDDRELDLEVLYALPADRVELERRYDVSTAQLGTPDAREEWVLFLLWIAGRRAIGDELPGTFEAFLAELAGYEFVGGTSVADPTVEEARIE